MFRTVYLPRTEIQRHPETWNRRLAIKFCMYHLIYSTSREWPSIGRNTRQKEAVISNFRSRIRPLAKHSSCCRWMQELRPHLDSRRRCMRRGGPLQHSTRGRSILQTRRCYVHSEAPPALSSYCPATNAGRRRCLGTVIVERVLVSAKAVAQRQWIS